MAKPVTISIIGAEADLALTPFIDKLTTWSIIEEAFSEWILSFPKALIILIPLRVSETKADRVPISSRLILIAFLNLFPSILKPIAAGGNTRKKIVAKVGST